MTPPASEILAWLRERDEGRLQTLWEQADQVRRLNVGDDVHLRGLVEISNYCDRECLYCGLRLPNLRIQRYRMSPDEILAAARQALDKGYGSVVLQSGEDEGFETESLCEIVRRIKQEASLAVTLSLGERSLEDLARLRSAGADRYLLRFETSNRELLAYIHPPRAGSIGGDRIGLLAVLRDLGYEVGSGVMVGIPGQTYADLARDLALFQELDLDMIGVGPYLPHPDTPLCDVADRLRSQTPDAAPADELTVYKMLALTRLVCPRANIPSTTALATINTRQGRLLGLQRGANVVMPNLTPGEYRARYEIYPHKAGSLLSPDESHARIVAEIHSLGRRVGRGRGDSRNYLARGEREPSRWTRNP